MPITLIVECDKCKGLMLVGGDQKTRTCPFCGAKVNVQRVKRLASAENSMMASEILKKIKSDRQMNTQKSKLSNTKVKHQSRF